MLLWSVVQKVVFHRLCLYNR